MLPIYTKNEEITDIVNNLLQNDFGQLIFMPSDRMVHLGLNGDCDQEYCKENNIFILYIGRHGGSIVCSKGDVDYFSVGTGVQEANKGMNFLGHLKDYLISKGLDAKFDSDGNDILVDGYKVASYGNGLLEARGKDVFTTGIHVSINIDIDSIKKICQKTMDKIPKALSDFGITTEEIKQLMVEYFNNYE